MVYDKTKYGINIYFNNIPFTTCQVDLPRSGQWNATAIIKNYTLEERDILIPNLSAQLEFGPGFSKIGTIKDVRIVGDTLTVKIIGGAGKMAEPTKATNINNISSVESAGVYLENKTLSPTTPVVNVFAGPNITLEEGTTEEIFFELNVAETTPEPNWNNKFYETPYLNVDKETLIKNNILYKQAYTTNVDNDNYNISILLNNSKFDKLQALENVAAGPQLSKLLKTKTNNQDTVWRLNDEGNIVYCYDNNTNILSPSPTEKFTLKSNSNLIRFQIYEYDYGFEPGAWLQDETSMGTKWRIEHITLNVDTTECIATLYKRSLGSTIREISKPELQSFNQNYSAIISKQNSDGTVDLLPDDNLIKGGGIAQIPIRGPLGVKQYLQAGVKAVVQYENNDPSRPYICGFYEMTNEQHSNNNDFYIVYGNTSQAQFVALADKVLTELQNIKTWANTHKHTGVTTGTGTSATTDTPLSDPSSVACKRIKSE